MNWLRLSCLAAFIFSCAYSTRAAIPAGDDLPTQAQFNRKYLAGLQKAGSQVYRASGHRDPKWDQKAIEFLDGCDKLTTDQPDAMADADLAAMGQQVIAAGCNDPLVAYGYGKVLEVLGQRDKARPYLQRAAGDLARFGYPALRQAFAQGRLAASYGEGKEGQQASNALAALLPQVLDDAALKADRALLVYVLKDLLEKTPRKYQQAFYDAVKGTPGVDHVVLGAVEGMYHVQAAWLARGGGWANTVTEQGWQGFEQHLAAAKVALTKAWEADPMIPEVSRAMMTVCLGQSDPPAMRLWFERAVKARFDYAPAYTQMLLGLYPRWGGSREAMLAFGKECYETGRYDTSIPYVYVTALFDARRDEGGDFGGWFEPGVYEIAGEVLEKTAAHPNHRRKADQCRTLYAALAARTGHWADARRVLDALGERLNAQAALSARFRPEGLRARAYAYTGPAARIALAAAENFAEGKLEPAATLYEQAAAVLQDKPAARFLRSAARAVRWQIQFETGQPLALEIDQDLTGWEADQGSWSAQDGWIVGRCDRADIRLGCLAAFGPQWEFSADVQFQKPEASWTRSGVLLIQNYGWHWLGCFVCPGDRKVAVGGLGVGEKEEALPMDPDQTVKLVVQRDVGQVNVLVNGRTVFSRHALPRYQPANVERIALGGDVLPPGAVIRFRNLRIRKIDRLPRNKLAADWSPPGVTVPPLAQAAAPELRRKEIASPTEAAAQLELADAWWSQAQSQDGRDQELAQQRAALWYDLALPRLAGADKQRIEQRLKQVPESCAWEAIAAKAKEGLSRSGTVGGTGGGAHEEMSPDGVLVGFVVSAASFSGHQVIKALQPVWLTPRGRAVGQWHGRKAGKEIRVEAHKGYAVGAIVAKGGMRVDGFKIIFMRLRGDALDPEDAYESAWLGGQGGGKEMPLGNARPVVGFYGRAGADLDCAGLIQLEP